MCENGSENIQNCCRICLDTESDHVPIFGDSLIHLQIKSCLGMTISANDNLPTTICGACVSQLNDFYNFQLNAHCSQDWLESSRQERAKKPTDSKLPVQPLPDSEYNSDSLLEFLNNTANIEEYLNNLGKEDIPCIVNMLDRNQENSLDSVSKMQNTKSSSPKKKDTVKSKNCIKVKIDVLDSDVEIVKELLMKGTEPKQPTQLKETNVFICFGCKEKFEKVQKLSEHLGTCDTAARTCIHCNALFDSKLKLQHHFVVHLPLTCNCGKHFTSREKLAEHLKTCSLDNATLLGCQYRCKQCNKMFKERFQLYKHAKEHVIKAQRRICDICGQFFNGNESLMKHRKEDHKKTKNMMYRCKVCRYTSSDHKDLYVHVQKKCLTAVLESDKHLCETCGKSFTTKATLLRHTLHHITDHRCNICQKTFLDARTRDEHVLGHIETTVCEKCGQSVCSYKLEGHTCV